MNDSGHDDDHHHNRHDHDHDHDHEDDVVDEDNARGSADGLTMRLRA